MSETKILTVAGCIGNNRGIKVRVGSENPLNGGIVRSAEVTLHPKFQNNILSYHDTINNVAVLSLDEPLVFNSKVGKISLFDDVLPPNVKLTVSGYGNILENGWLISIFKNLRYIDMPLIDLESCKKDYKYSLNQQNFCASLENNRTHTLVADYGGNNFYLFIIKI